LLIYFSKFRKITEANIKCIPEGDETMNDWDYPIFCIVVKLLCNGLVVYLSVNDCKDAHPKDKKVEKEFDLVTLWLS
jgi:hypothetical protein